MVKSEGGRMTSERGDMAFKLSDKSWSIVSRIFSANARLELEHESGRLILKTLYLNGKPIVVARIETLSADAERDLRHYVLQLCDIPFLLTHAAQVIQQGIGNSSQADKESAPG